MGRRGAGSAVTRGGNAGRRLGRRARGRLQSVGELLEFGQTSRRPILRHGRQHRTLVVRPKLSVKLGLLGVVVGRGMLLLRRGGRGRRHGSGGTEVLGIEHAGRGRKHAGHTSRLKVGRRNCGGVSVEGVLTHGRHVVIPLVAL